ncbi:hypothetical protein [Natrinema versiforme]|uniref:Uncharacterized protein n=1 Tax=Natrinema versiforme TaxID=88724 RepID=A0A4P8WK45_9EURY|nr:hypothetical protein [Natrinema versiforme]QCS43878.1 hypothetical protein FEJ81_16555 [Natrinema versiforme]
MTEQKYEIPEKDEMRDDIGQRSLRGEMYTDLVSLLKVLNQYEEPIPFEYALYRAYHDYDYSLSPDADDYSAVKDKHKTRLDKAGRWDEEVVGDVVGRIPTAEVWVEYVSSELGYETVTEQNLNEVQKACVRIGDERKDEYYKACGREFQERILEDADSILDDSGTIGEFIDEVLGDFARLAAEEFPSRVNAGSQGGKSSAGSANEELARRLLLAAGLTEGESEETVRNFTTETEDDSDVIVFGNDDQTMYVEVKSTSIRERVRRALMGEGNYWSLFGFFGNAEKVRSEVLEGNLQGEPWSEQSAVAYVPPEVVSKVEDIDEKEDDGNEVYKLENEDGLLYLRANNVFAQDMVQFTQTGELTDIDPGHEDQYI